MQNAFNLFDFFYFYVSTSREELCVEEPWMTVTSQKPALETPARWSFLHKEAAKIRHIRPTQHSLCDTLFLLQCPHNVHKLDGYICDNSQVRPVSRHVFQSAAKAMHAWTPLFDPCRDGVMAGDAGLVTDSAKDSGASVRIKPVKLTTSRGR